MSASENIRNATFILISVKNILLFIILTIFPWDSPWLRIGTSQVLVLPFVVRRFLSFVFD